MLTAPGPRGASTSPSQAAQPAQPRSLRASASSLPGALPAGDGDPGWAPLNGRTAVVVGAGPAGCTLAMYLARAGWRVRVFEKRPEPGPATTSRQRSWAICMYPRGIRAVKAVAEVPLLRERAYKGQVILPANPESKPTVLERCGALLDRTLMATSLLESARQQYGSRVEFMFSAPLERVDFGRRMAVFGPEDKEAKVVRETVSAGVAASAGGGVTGPIAAAAALGEAGAVKGVADDVKEVPYDLLVGADGSASTVRSLLAEAFPGRYDTKILYAPSSVPNGFGYYKSFTGLPPLPEVERWDPDSGADPASRLPGQFFIILAGGSKGVVCLGRDIDGTYGGYMAGSMVMFSGQHTREDYLALLPQCGPQLPTQWLPLMAEKLVEAPLTSMPSVRIMPRFWSPGGVVLVGDAAHTVTPALGQGLNSALQDCELLGRELEGLGSDPSPAAVDRALQRFSDLRVPEIRALQELEILQSNRTLPLKWASRKPGDFLMVLLRKWVMFQYTRTTLAGAALLAALRALSGSTAGGSATPAVKPGGDHTGEESKQRRPDEKEGREDGRWAPEASDVLASQINGTYVRSPPLYEVVSSNMEYSEILGRVYGMAALGTGITAALLYGGGVAVAGLLRRLVAGG